ncbi:DnaJ-domain-containing protein [Ramicandelaber brevisporus]|nr:DnaJ-domain-containing protein [Ramicandelaber brevisporus]
MAPKATCYYELIGVDQTATAGEIKKAYRRRALEWHPDRNLHRTAEATEHFAKIQAAYDVLSDEHERAFYDNHRDEILRGDEPGSGDADDDDDYYDSDAAETGAAPRANEVRGTSASQLMRYFSAACFNGFEPASSGSKNSFFVVYGNLFTQLSSEEQRVHDPATADIARLMATLSFGDATTQYVPEVRDFYAFWSTFSSRKSFGWMDKWRLRDAQTRYARRCMESENADARTKARNEFNDTVRNLVAFVRKRDPRVQQYLAEQRKAQDEKQAALKQKRAEEIRANLEKAKAYVAADWTKVEAPSHYEDEFSGGTESEYDEYDDEDGEDSDGEGEDSDEAVEIGAGDEDDELIDDVDLEDELYCAACDKQFNSVPQMDNHLQSKKHQKAVAAIRKQMLREEREAQKQQKQQPKQQKEQQIDSSPIDSLADQLEDADIDDADDLDVYSLLNSKKSQKKKNKAKRNGMASFDSSDDFDFEPALAPAESDAEVEPAHVVESEVSEEAENKPASEELIAESKPTISKKQLREQRKAKKEQKAAAAEGAHACNVCKSSFDTRNKLFDHIKATGHALAAPSNSKQKKRR